MPLKNASDHLLSHWTHSSKQNEDLFQQTCDFLEELKSVWIAEEEYLRLKYLLEQNESDLVYRYLELQLNLRTADERNPLHISIELEKELENHLKNAEKSRLSQELALRTMEHIVGNWIASLGLLHPPIVMDLSEGNFGAKMKHNLALALKEGGFKLASNEALFVENLLEKSEDTLEYWNRICACVEQLLTWEGILDEVLHSIKIHPRTNVLDQETLDIKLDSFEKELISFHNQLGKILSENLLIPFSDDAKAIISGKFRKQFGQINNAYGDLKSALIGTQLDMHLCCTCHFGKEDSPYWDTKTRAVDLVPIKPFYTHVGSLQKSLLIFTCGGGRGHLSVTKAMSEFAKGKYHVSVANTLEETLASTDVFKRMLLNFSQERLYNHLLRNEEFEWLKVMTSVGPFFLMMQQESIERQIRLEVLKQNPDLIITCFPCLNAMFLNVAKELNLPILMVTTDLNTDLFTKGMHPRSCDLNYPKWRMTLAYETPEMRAIIEKRIPPGKIHVSGFPIRSAFNTEPPDMEKGALRQKFGIEQNDQTLLVMIGGVAGTATEKYATVLSSLSAWEASTLTRGNLHIICLCGDQNFHDNREMRLRINAMQPGCSRVRMHGIGTFEDMASLMSIADALITKPGGCSTSEALAKGLPMIFHAPFALMDWEVFNMEFCIRTEMGSRFKLQSISSTMFQDGIAKNKQRLIPLIQEAFSRRKQKPQYAFEKKDFGQEFLHLVEELVNG